MSIRSLSLCLAILFVSTPVLAGSSLDLGANDAGISFGNSPRWSGIRINAVDHDIEDLRGLNITLWKPKPSPDGTMTGLNVGLWGPEADHLRGLHFGIASIAAHRRLSGIGVSLLGCAVGDGEGDGNWGRHRGYSQDATMTGVFVGGIGLASAGDIRGVAMGGLGMGAGANITGLAAGGLGLGVGGDLTGIAVGGLGMGVGGSARGVMLAGLGMGVGDDLGGIAFSTIGFGVGEDAQGLIVSGVGAGIGENFTGIGITGVGMGVGADFTGIGVSGVGMGIGGSGRGLLMGGIGSGVGSDFTGIALSGFGMGVGDRLKGIGIAGIGIGAKETRGITLALGRTRGEEMHGFTASAYNSWNDSMTGLSIGLINITNELHGVQLGLINIVRDNPSGRRILPIINWGG